MQNKIATENNGNSKLLQVKRRELDSFDINLWEQYGIPKQILHKYKVNTAAAIWVDHKLVYTFRKGDPGYIYDFGEDNFKIYFPYRHVWRFMSNTTRIQGYAQLPFKGSLLIITKSLKDVMVLASFGIPAIALQTETMMPEGELIYELQSRFDNIITLYDWDKTGRHTAWKIRKEFGIPAYFLTNGKFGTKNYMAKDPAEYVQNHGKVKSRALLLSLIEDINEKSRYNNRNTGVHNSRKTLKSQESEVLHEGGRNPQKISLLQIQSEKPTDRPF